MSKFKAGDKVKIVRHAYNMYSWTEKMEKMIGDGKVYTIGRENGDRHYNFKDSYPDYFTWSEDSLELAESNTIVTVFKVGDMEFSTKDEAADHLLRKNLDDFIKGCGGEEKFVNYIVNNKQKMIDILTKEYK